MKVTIGVDEAGRGCAIGCLFIAAVAFREEDLGKLSLMGVVDSKRLTRPRRERLAEEIRRVAVDLEVVSVEPSTIDSMNLNHAEAQAVEGALRALSGRLRARGLEVSRVVVDLFGPRELVEGAVARGCPGAAMVLEHDADDKYVECSAASIIAKVSRDRHIDELKAQLGDFGSGYPSDPRTEEWVRRYFEEHGELPGCVRRSWRTILRAAPQAYLAKGRRAARPPHRP